VRASFALVVVLLGVVALAGCGGGGADPGEPAGAPAEPSEECREAHASMGAMDGRAAEERVDDLRASLTACESSEAWIEAAFFAGGLGWGGVVRTWWVSALEEFVGRDFDVPEFDELERSVARELLAEVCAQEEAAGAPACADV
jgi:hypothetical protein